MIPLTAADRAEIDRLSIVLGVREHEIGIVYCAGMAAMAERCAKVCDDMSKPHAGIIVGAYRQGHDDGCDRCAAAIRALVKPS